MNARLYARYLLHPFEHIFLPVIVSIQEVEKDHYKISDGADAIADISGPYAGAIVEIISIIEKAKKDLSTPTPTR